VYLSKGGERERERERGGEITSTRNYGSSGTNGRGTNQPGRRRKERGEGEEQKRVRTLAAILPESLSTNSGHVKALPCGCRVGSCSRDPIDPASLALARRHGGRCDNSYWKSKRFIRRET